MKFDRTKNSIQGITSGILNKLICLLLPFIVRTVFINTLGIEYLGLNSLFTSLLNIINLAELGVGSAISFSLYSAIAKNNRDDICSLLNLYRKYYFRIGIIILVIGILLIPFLPYICNLNVSININIYAVYILYLTNTALGYLLYSYKSSLFIAHQQNYIVNNINSIVNVLLNIFQLISLLIFKNYYIFLLILLISTILNNILVNLYSNKVYPEYIPTGEIDSNSCKRINKKIKALFFYKIGGVVLTSVDSVVISYFIGLSALGKYNSYYYVITTLFGFIQIILGSLLAGIGNSIETESVEKNYNDFKKLMSLQSWLICFCTICLICLYQNFMYLWIGKENMFNLLFVILLSTYFYFWKMMDIINLYKDAAGIWEYDRYRPLIASIVNLGLNIALVNMIGIYGIIISTIISIIIIIFPWSSFYQRASRYAAIKSSWQGHHREEFRQ